MNYTVVNKNGPWVGGGFGFVFVSVIWARLDSRSSWLVLFACYLGALGFLVIISGAGKKKSTGISGRAPLVVSAIALASDCSRPFFSAVR